MKIEISKKQREIIIEALGLMQDTICQGDINGTDDDLNAIQSLVNRLNFIGYHNQAIELLKKISPDASDEELEKTVKFGFWLAASPQDFIDVLREKVSA